MTPDTILTLGEFEFSGTEIPEEINFGGEQLLARHPLIGGARVIDAMGRSDDPIRWRGLLRGETALARARYLDGLRTAGNSVRLSVSELLLVVVVKRFSYRFQRFYQIPYEIECEVVEDANTPVTDIAPPAIDDLIYDDLAMASGLGDLIGDGILSDLLGGLDSAIRSVSSFATAAQSTINAVLAPMAAVQARVKVLIGSVGNVAANVGTLGGILPNNPISTNVAKLAGQVAAFSQLPNLYNLQSVLGRMGGNLGTIGTGVRTVTTAGGNLFSMASQAYGDATAWTGIAKANGLVDPMLSGINNVVIPAVKDGLGGVLDA